MRATAWMAWSLTACAQPTMFGAFTDGVGPARGTTDVTVVGAGAASSALGPGAGGGFVVAPALGERTSLALGGGTYVPLNDDLPIIVPLWSFQVRRRVERDLNGRNHLMWIAGTGGTLYPTGLHLALIGARDVGPWRVYGGGGFQVTWLYSVGNYGLATAGVTWNPPQRRLSVGLEAAALLGFDTGVAPFSDPGEQATYGMGVASVYLRSQIGKGKEKGARR